MNYYIVTIELLNESHETLLGISDDGLQIGIPRDPENLDYQAFLQWEQDGNTPERYQPPA
jgi:phosphorylcholine metabolism protein LicD